MAEPGESDKYNCWNIILAGLIFGSYEYLCKRNTAHMPNSNAGNTGFDLLH